MKLPEIQLLETALVVLAVIVGRRILGGVLKKIYQNLDLQERRFRLINKIKDIILYAVALVFILTIWSVGQSDVLLFVSSFLTILGITLFAQWSLLSNITAGIILFVNHPAKVGDRVQVLDKDFNISGDISDIGLFFISITTDENNEITIPNSMIFQKMVKIGVQAPPKPQ
ncbi:mechanosensitive ion channel domain-containing protein [Persicitalea jodogahamensis]|uniref:Mechanosensitive ion channel protein MscS n=1 Tax=Persicitalea jodogahamensis TaxID=402147 RepID=A0A8J3D3K1_9BACT|nr:mechanosensitive ion channel domain-containing protein [Persicitalea jodogahamensis]GHB68846.1 mechanosensitive ion channel protein MscS [Persicitalea jodogahamensis]